MRPSGGGTAGARPGRTERWCWGLALATGAVAAAIFLARPEIDLGIARAFYAGDGGFVGQHLGWVRGLRQAFVVLYFGAIALCLVGLALVWLGRQHWLRLGKAEWLFMAACLAAGPGLVANLLFKDHWGRARPSQIAEFGGSKGFTPPLVLARQCKRNCSFISGEAASTYATLYAAAAVVPQWAGPLIVAGTIGGLATGLVRMSQGAHFLSDIVFAGVFMALTVLALRQLVLRGWLSSGVRPTAPAREAPGPPP